MLEGSLPCFRFCCEFLREQVKQIDPADADLDPTGDLKTPRWQVGHLLTIDLMTAQTVGADVGGPDIAVLMPAFGPGSDPHAVGGDLPGLSELMAAKSEVEPKVEAAVAAADVADFGDPHGVDLLSQWPLRTKADLVAHLMTTHFATHLGELAMWRRAKGVPPLF